MTRQFSLAAASVPKPPLPLLKTECITNKQQGGNKWTENENRQQSLDYCLYIV